MDECGGDEHAGAEVAGEEEGVVGHGQFREAAHNQREAAGEGAEREDEEEGEDVQRGVVVAQARRTAACRSFVIGLPASQFRTEEVEGNICKG